MGVSHVAQQIVFPNRHLPPLYRDPVWLLSSYRIRSAPADSLHGDENVIIEREPEG
jgi:hypothetical protein